MHVCLKLTFVGYDSSCKNAELDEVGEEVVGRSRTNFQQQSMFPRCCSHFWRRRGRLSQLMKRLEATKNRLGKKRKKTIKFLNSMSKLIVSNQVSKS